MHGLGGHGEDVALLSVKGSHGGWGEAERESDMM